LGGCENGEESKEKEKINPNFSFSIFFEPAGLLALSLF